MSGVPHLCTLLLAVSYLRQCLELSVNGNGYGVGTFLLSLSFFLSFPFFFSLQNSDRLRGCSVDKDKKISRDRKRFRLLTPFHLRAVSSAIENPPRLRLEFSQ